MRITVRRTRPSRLPLLPFLLVLLPNARGACAEDAQPQVRVALALSGGGARGVAHIGALRALEEAGIPVDAIAANSIGAVVGGIFATGRGASELEAAVRSQDWASLFSARLDRRTQPIADREDRYGALAGVSFDWRHVRLPAGLVDEHRVNRFLIQNLAPAAFAAGGDFDRLPVRFRAVATDLADGEPVVLARGDLARAVRASMSIPLAFPPVEWQGRRLVDGFVVDNLPIDVARRWNPRVVVAVDAESPELQPAEYASALGVANRVNDLLTKRRNLDFRAEADVLIRPDLGRHSATDYSGIDELIRRGYEATKAALPQIREKLAAAGVTDLEPRVAVAAGRPLAGAPIRDVVVRGNRTLADDAILGAFGVAAGARFEMRNALHGFDKIDAMGRLARTWIELEPLGDGVHIVLRVEEAPPNRAEVSLGYSEWERTRAAVRLLNQGTLGSSERLELLLGASDAETLARLSLRGDRLLVGGLGYAVRAAAGTDKPRFFDTEGKEVNRATFDRTSVELALRAPLKRWFEVEGGLRVGSVKTRAEAGITLPVGSDELREVHARAAYDTLDSAAWPERGERLAVSGAWSPAGLGPSHRYTRFEVEARLGHSFGERTVLQLDAFVGLSGGELPIYDQYRLGGVELLPGYHHEQLIGAQGLAAAASVRQRLPGGLRLVTRFGLGNVFDRTREIRLAGVHWGAGVGLMLPTRVGPVVAELGLRDGGGTLVSFALGWN